MRENEQYCLGFGLNIFSSDSKQSMKNRKGILKKEIGLHFPVERQTRTLPVKKMAVPTLKRPRPVKT